MKLEIAFAVLVFHQACQALPTEDIKSNEVVDAAEEKKALKMAKLEAILNDNLYQFLTALTTLDLEEVKAHNKYIRKLINATKDNTFDYSGVIESLPSLINQPKEEQLINFLLLLKKKLRLREPRVFEILDAMLDIFSSVDMQQVTDIMKQTPEVIQGMTNMITGIVDIIADI